MTRAISAARNLMAAFGVLEGWGSRVRFVVLRLRSGPRKAAPPVPLRLRALRGRPLWVRPGTSDAMVVVEDFVHGFATPPPEVEDPVRIVELGTNIGAGLALLAERHPKAVLLGVEADPENARLARRNLIPWADRCRLVEAAVAETSGRVIIDRRGGRETGFTVRIVGPAEPGLEVRALSVDDLLADFQPNEPIDYLYMDIEGSHRELFKGTPGWIERVRAIKVSRHLETDYSEYDCADDLERLGFSTRVVALKPTGWTIGVRP